MGNFQELSVITSNVAHWEKRVAEMQNNLVQIENDLANAKGYLTAYKKDFDEKLKQMNLNSKGGN